MEELIAKKESANSLMNSGDYDNAINEFTNIINLITPKNEDEAIIKSLCLLNRSICHIHKENLDDALGDAKLVIETSKIVRPNLDFTPEDKFSGILALAELRIGQIYESKQETLLAMKSYTNSIHYNPKAGAQDCLFRVYGDLGLPMLDIQDPDLKFFSDLILEIPNEKGVVESISRILTFFEQSEIPESVLDKFADEGVYLIIFVVMQLYIEDPIIVTSLLIMARNLAEKGILDVFDGSPVVRNAIDHWKQNPDVIGSAIKFLSLSVTSSISDDDFVEPMIDALDIEITRDEADMAFMLLFNLVHSEETDLFKGKNIVEKIFKWKTNSSILLLSKVVHTKEICEEAYNKGSLIIAKNILQNVDDEFLIAASLQIISNISTLNEEKFNDDIPNIIDIIMKVVTKNSKNVTIATNCFSCLSFLLPKSVEKIKEVRAVRAASLIFLVNQKEESVVRSVISFFFVAAKNGLANSITEIPNLVSSLLNSLPMYVENQEIMEKAICIAAVTNHPKAKALICFGLDKFPESVILKSLVANISE
ncbi:hypothetical protein TVAG_134950 [Trichomonas vaginalis G3]|uniref:TPR Domain containing protein n=1 Tax=Trichomonas vaginalis (strain ATCC PRA-98 / G3) TaxID=412133 RepID=A2FKH6_TRIV3|nr:tetratricopeptide repeat domain domain-containing protein [Trichomonas vaginalis G3]EAX94588.1 hypothetical protein TVAG_134950 [Trichomonas vaginalis G3]KAI5542788.1 tetratricopeptide repeat domain domain-containing protein [Trichomonas vaginalis G3]|eukprot:XP_001307518.1 hypothetical protein [Trichomonas vaginalis G3]